MRKFICIRGEEYQTKSGETKAPWYRLGELIETDKGKQYVKLYTMPDKLLSVFGDKRKGESSF